MYIDKKISTNVCFNIVSTPGKIFYDFLYVVIKILFFRKIYDFFICGHDFLCVFYTYIKFYMCMFICFICVLSIKSWFLYMVIRILFFRKIYDINVCRIAIFPFYFYYTFTRFSSNHFPMLLISQQKDFYTRNQTWRAYFIRMFLLTK